jgi:integrase
MARIRSNFETAKARLRLAVKPKSYSVPLAPGTQLLYRRNLGHGAWSVKTAKWVKKFAVADDFESANGVTVMNYWQAQKRASELSRIGEGNVVVPVTVKMAVDDYAADVKARGAERRNADMLYFHLTDSPLWTKPVTLLIAKELSHWRNAIVASGLKPGTADRIGRSFKACLNLAAKHDKRITNGAEWKDALSRLKGSNQTRDNVILDEATVEALVAELYADDHMLGVWADLLAETGCRESQGVKLKVSDLQDNRTDLRLMMPCSLKGRNRVQESKPVSITAYLASVLREASAGREQNEPLLDPMKQMAILFQPAVKRLGLSPTITPYSFRHSNIVRNLLANVPIRVVASNHDTSVGEIERCYSKHISDVSDSLTRPALRNLHKPVVGNVVPIKRAG